MIHDPIRRNRPSPPAEDELLPPNGIPANFNGGRFKPTRSATARSRTSGSVPVDRICDAALKLFVQKGYRATTIDEIARRGRLTKGAIYYYFKSKAQLLGEILNRIEVSYPRKKPVHGDPREKFVSFLHVQAKWAIERPNDLFLLMLMSIEFKSTNNAIKLKIQKIYLEMSSAIAEIFEEGKAAGVFSSTLSTSQLGSLYLAAHDGMMLEWYRAGRDTTKGMELVQAFRHVMLSTLEAPPHR